MEAHHAQTALLTQEASGDPVALSLLMVHGQNHLFTAITFKDMANEIIDIYQKLEVK
ncbi:PTS lactose/cellobiose transporter subunit IIA [Enterococcus faecalis]|nr:PTS lactose/cellobiose transporter subunit IIA [Enterococcus faecalis]